MCALTRDQDIHGYETQDKDNDQTGRHRAVVYDCLPSQAGVNFANRLPSFIKKCNNAQDIKNSPHMLFSSKTIYCAMSFGQTIGRLPFLKTDPVAGSGVN